MSVRKFYGFYLERPFKITHRWSTLLIINVNAIDNIIAFTRSVKLVYCLDLFLINIVVELCMEYISSMGKVYPIDIYYT